MSSLEVSALERFIMATGLGHRITDVNTPGVHSPTSYHYAIGSGGIGLAVDVAWTKKTQNSPQLDAIFDCFARVAGQLAELTYANAEFNIRNGREVAPYDAAAHHNHVHVAVKRGTLVQWRWEPIVPPPSSLKEASKMINMPAVDMHFTPTGKGYRIFAADGGVFCFGDAQFYGSMGGQRMNEKIVKAAVTPSGKGYVLLGADGGTFVYGDANAVFDSVAPVQGRKNAVGWIK